MAMVPFVSADADLARGDVVAPRPRGRPPGGAEDEIPAGDCPSRARAEPKAVRLAKLRGLACGCGDVRHKIGRSA